MSKENVEIVRRCGEAFDRGNYQAALDALDPEVEYDLSHFPEGRVYHGHEGVRESFRIWLGTWEDYHQERVEIIDANDQVVVVVREQGRVREAVWRSFARATPCGRCVTGRPYESVSIPARRTRSTPPGCGSSARSYPERYGPTSAVTADMRANNSLRGGPGGGGGPSRPRIVSIRWCSASFSSKTAVRSSRPMRRIVRRRTRSS
jgi:ketosteroid isomerase-like protein